MRRERWPTVSGGTYSTTVTSSASTHTKGAWAQVAATTSFDAVLETVLMGCNDPNLFLVDLGAGAAGNEQIVVPDLIMGHGTSATSDLIGWRRISGLGLRFPSGTRLAARCSSAGSSQRVALAYELTTMRAGQWPVSRAETYGTTLATTRGTSVDPGGSANTKGSWVQLTASSGLNATRWLACFTNQGNNAPANAQWGIDLGIGGAGSEQIVVPDLWMLSAAIAGYAFLPGIAVVGVSGPAGSRVAARAMCNITDATDRLFDLSVTALARAALTTREAA